MNSRQVAQRAGAGTLLVVALAVGQSVDSASRHRDAGRPYEHSVAPGQEVTVRWGTIKVFGVRGGTSVTRIGTENKTPGVWVVTDYSFDPRGAREGIRFAELVADDGTIYTSTGRSDGTCPLTNPGVPVMCHAVFEVAREAAAGSRLRLAVDSDDPKGDDLVVVDLQITDDTLDTWSRQNTPVVVDIDGPLHEQELLS